MIYTTDNDTLQVAVHHYPIDGAQIIVSKWDGEDFITLYDSRVIADSLWEGVIGALVEALGIDSHEADFMCAEWGIYAPLEEEEEAGN